MAHIIGKLADAVARVHRGGIDSLRGASQFRNIEAGGKALDVSNVELLGDAQKVVVHLLDFATLDSLRRILGALEDPSILGIDGDVGVPEDLLDALGVCKLEIEEYRRGAGKSESIRR